MSGAIGGQIDRSVSAAGCTTERPVRPTVTKSYRFGASAMEQFLGGLSFVVLIAAQFLGVVFVASWRREIESYEKPRHRVDSLRNAVITNSVEEEIGNEQDYHRRGSRLSGSDSRRHLAEVRSG
jgi:hypothetical protein